MSDWTLDDETAFDEIMRAGGLTRIQAIQLYCRMKHDLEKCLQYLKEQEE